MKTLAPFNLVLIAAGLAVCTAQTPVPKPEAPFVAETPKNSTYTITITYPGAEAPETLQAADEVGQRGLAADRPQLVQVWQDASTKRVLVTHANGKKIEGYLFESGFVIRSVGDSNKTFVSGVPQGASATSELFTKGFQGTQWIQSTDFRSIEKVGDAECYSFHRKALPLPVFDASGPPAGFDSLKYIDLTANIRVSDRFPVVVQIGPATYTFSNPQPWVGTLTIPDNFKSSADSFTKEMSVLEALRKKKK